MGKKPLVGIIGLVWAWTALTGCDCCSNKDKSVQKPPYSPQPTVRVFDRNNPNGQTASTTTPTPQPGGMARMPGGPGQTGDVGVKTQAPDNLPSGLERSSSGFIRTEVPPSGPGSQGGSPAPVASPPPNRFDLSGRSTGTLPLTTGGAPTAAPGDPGRLPPPPVLRSNGLDQAPTVGAPGSPPPQVPAGVGLPPIGSSSTPGMPPPPPPNPTYEGAPSPR